MGQRFNIQYSIDTEDLKDEVERLLNKSFSKINKLSNTSISNRLSLGTLEDIDEVRQQLAGIDATLEDVSAIIAGFISYKSSDNAHVEQKPVDKDKVKSDYEVPAQDEYSF